jgi:hypothetical protein
MALVARDLSMIRNDDRRVAGINDEKPSASYGEVANMIDNDQSAASPTAAIFIRRLMPSAEIASKMSWGYSRARTDSLDQSRLSFALFFHNDQVGRKEHPFNVPVVSRR